jgi:hypothetical protein
MEYIDEDLVAYADLLTACTEDICNTFSSEILEQI